MKGLLIVCLLLSTCAFSQEKTKLPRLNKINWFGDGLDLKMNSWQKKSIVPSALMLAGVSLNSINTKTSLQNAILDNFNGYTTKIDDILPFAPIATMYLADLAKQPSRHNIWHKSKYLFISQAVTGGIVFALKGITGITRPDGSSNTSFPSGHTGVSAVSAQVLFNEYYRTRPLIGLSGYLFAGGTGLLRVVNNKHWLPDVLMGAGIGILVTNLVYHFQPLKNWNPFKNNHKDHSLLILPQAVNDTYGFQMQFSF